MIGINDKVILRKFTHRGHTAKIEQERWYYATSFKKLYNGNIFQYSCRIPKATLASVWYPEQYIQCLWEHVVDAVYFAINKEKYMNKPFRPYDINFTDEESVKWLSRALKGEIQVVETRYLENPVADVCLCLSEKSTWARVKVGNSLLEIIEDYFGRVWDGVSTDAILIDNALNLCEYLRPYSVKQCLKDLLTMMRNEQSDERLTNVVNALRAVGNKIIFEFWEYQFLISSPYVKKACFGAMLEISLPQSIPYIPMLEATRNTVKATRLKIDYYLEEYPEAEQEQILRAIKSIEKSVEGEKWEALTGYASRKLALKEAHIGPIAREAV